jgi:hypothetical protein
MSSLFRSNQPRSPPQPPPSSFKRTGPSLTTSLAVAVSSADRAHRRVSRTHDDFEAALRGEDTMVLQEGRDIRSLGVHDTPPSRTRSGSAASIRAQPPTTRTSTDTIPGRRQTVSTPKHTSRQTPATPVVVPPTPTTVTHTPTAPLDDADDDDDEDAPNARRRSMFRSAGTASSPDLATLVRKARDTREQTQDHLEPTPTDRARTKSTASSAFEFVESSPIKTPLKQPARDRALTSPDPVHDGSPRLRGSRRRLAKAEKALPVNRTPVVNDPSSSLMSDIGEGRSDREGKVSTGFRSLAVAHVPRPPAALHEE